MKCKHETVRYGNYIDQNGHKIFLCNECHNTFEDSFNIFENNLEDLENKNIKNSSNFRLRDPRTGKVVPLISWNADGSMKDET